MVWYDPLTWNWAMLTTAAIGPFFGAGFGTALIQAVLPFYRDRRQRKSQAAYMAMRLAITLEFYAWACSTFNANNANAQPDPDSEFPAWDVTLPELPPFPDDADGWRAIDRGLAGRCLNLRNKIHGSQAMINDIIEHALYDLGNTVARQGAARGLEAWKLAVELRRKHDVEEADTVWNYPGELERTLRQAEKEERESREQNARAISDLFPSGDGLPAPESKVS
jgi:hypothetical protein